MRLALWCSVALVGSVACGDSGGGGGGGAGVCSVGAPIDWSTSLDLEGAAPAGDQVAVWIAPVQAPRRLLVASADGSYQDAGEVQAARVELTGSADRPAAILERYEDGGANLFYQSAGLDPASLGEPARLTDTASSTELQGALWTGTETLLIVRDERAELFPDAGETGTVTALMRVDADGAATAPVELEDAPGFVADPPLYTRIGSTVVSVERDGTELTLLQHPITGGPPLATTSFDLGYHNRFWILAGDDQATLAILRDDTIELVPIGDDLARGQSSTITLDHDLADMSAVALARQAGGWTVAYASPPAEAGSEGSTTIFARHFDAGLSLAAELGSDCAGTAATNAPVTIALPAGSAEPTIVWHHPAASWLGLTSF